MIRVGGRLIFGARIIAIYRLFLYFKSTLQQVVALNPQCNIKQIYEEKYTRVL